MIVVQAENLVKTYRGPAEVVKVIDGATLDLAAGELVVLMGPSGTGKTTLLSMLGCVLTPDAGVLRLCGRQVDWNESTLALYRRRYFGFISQRCTLLSSLTVRENVQIPMRLAGLRGSQMRQRCQEILCTMSLEHRADYSVPVLSGGEKQRASIARAMAADPPIILADEPTAYLDFRTGTEILSALRDMVSNHNKSVLLVTHDDRLTTFADRVIQIQDGRLVTSSTG